MSDEILVYDSEYLLDTYVIGTNAIEKTTFIENTDTNNQYSKNSSNSNSAQNNYDFYEHINKYKSEIGEKGEQFVLERERNKLNGTKYYSDIKQISKEDSTVGYDILSFENDGTELYIEVKTTEDNFHSFYITQNEINICNLLKSQGKRYLIYRVINILTNPTYYIIDDITSGYILEPIVWKAIKEI